MQLGVHGCTVNRIRGKTIQVWNLEENRTIEIDLVLNHGSEIKFLKGRK